MSALLKLLKNPKNILILALAVLVILIGLLSLWQRVSLKVKDNTITEQKASIAGLNVTNRDLAAQIADYKTQTIRQKALTAAQQAVENTTAYYKAEISKIKSQCVLGAEDEKIIDDVTLYFNNGVFSRGGDSKASGQILSTTGKADAYNPRWTIRQIVDNYIIVIDYALKMEKTIQCYGGAP
ncbi:MAG: hypothetical protein PHY46_05310 [Candidatus Omnitrophica bacterium]|nr:hypothetical protein [Candidatus Omnitrophota bacterium]